MNREVYCYNVRNATTGQKLIGGSQTATSMQDAARKILDRPDFKIVPANDGTENDKYPNKDILYKGTKVNLYVAVHPEYFKV